MRAVLASVVMLAACGRVAAPSTADKAGPARPALWSEPDEYLDRPPSVEAGADYFLRYGIGDPYGSGIALPILMAWMKAYPQLLGEDFRAFDRKFGTYPEPGKDGPADPPLGMHLTRDPNTGVQFVVANCQLCHARVLKLPSGDRLVSGLGNPRIRLHAYDAAFAKIARDPTMSGDRLLALANEVAERHHLAWPIEPRRAIVDVTLRLLRERDAARGSDALALENVPPGRVATIESFMMALNHQAGSKLALPKTPGLAKVPDVIGFPYRDTLSWDGVGVGAPSVLVAEANFAFGARPLWYDTHRHIGTSMYLYLRAFERSLPFPGPIDSARAEKGRIAFEEACARCHGTYSKVEGTRRTTYRERVVPLAEIGTDPARVEAVTEAFVDASNALPITRGLTFTAKGGGYVPPVLFDVWARAPYGHAGQWPDLLVLATKPELRPKRFVVELEGQYQLAEVGVPWHVDGAPSAGGYVHDGAAPGLGVGGHPFLADLGEDERLAVIEYLKTL